MAPRIRTRSFGPFHKGVLDTANPLLAERRGYARRLNGLTLEGGGKLVTRGGTDRALLFYDDQGTPAQIYSILAIAPFGTDVLVVGHSRFTDKIYLYRCTSTMDDWYNAAGILQGNTSPEPVGTLWSSVPDPPLTGPSGKVFITEGLGVAYIAHAEASDASGLYMATKTFVAPGAIGSLAASGTGGAAGADTAYFRGVIAFQQHLWGWGYGAGAVPGTGYRPELIRFSQPDFDPLQAVDSFTIGDRVQAVGEAVVCGGTVGDALILGAPHLLVRITGAGRTSWFKETVDRDHGIAGPNAAVAVGRHLYFWSWLGPCRVSERGAVEPLYGPLSAFMATVVQPEDVVVGFDRARNQVMFAVNTGEGLGSRTRLAYDIGHSAWLGPTDDWVLPVACMANIEPISITLDGPDGAPSALVTGSIGGTVATAGWTTGDSRATTLVEYRRQGDADWLTVATLAAGVVSCAMNGLVAGTDYEWRATHYRNSHLSGTTGPDAGSQFTTLEATVGGLSAPTDLVVTPTPGGSQLLITWTNTEADADTEVYVGGPSVIFQANALQYTAAPGVASVTIPEYSAGTFWVTVRHAKSGIYSADLGPVSCDFSPF